MSKEVMRAQRDGSRNSTGGKEEKQLGGRRASVGHFPGFSPCVS